LIPPGEFQMGSTDEQVEAALKVAEEVKADETTKNRIRDSERPLHRVRISRPFLISQMEVTIGQFKQFAKAAAHETEAERADAAAKIAAGQPAEPGKPAPAPYKAVETYLSPGYAASDEHPVTCITWNDAAAFCLWLSEQEKLAAPYEGNEGKWTVSTGKGYHL